ncbi:MAG: hypothetical protein AAF467_07460 [Actinomycetota bacterium]
MSRYRCVIQAGSAAAERSNELERRLGEHHAGHYPGEAVSVDWATVPAGYMFTEGRQSTSSIVSCTLDHPTTFASREVYMRGVCDLWTEVTGCTDHEVVVAVAENIPAASLATKE